MRYNNENSDLKLDVFQLDNQIDAIIFHVHGGGYVQGKRSVSLPDIQWFLENK